MFGWGESWQLVKASWAVLRSDKELLWFPVISGITMLLICAVMFIPSVAWAFSSAMVEGRNSENMMQVIGYVLLFLFYIVTYTVNIYFNVALVGAAMIRLDGGDPTLGDGFRTANERFGKIVGYAVISATVGLIMRFVQERGGWLGKIVSDIIGLAWNLATFLVIPILVVKDVGPIEAVKESASLLKRTWGEQITGGFSIGGIFFLIYLLLIIAGSALCAYLFYIENVGVAISVIVVIVFLFIAIGIVQGALNGIFQATLYRYAETGTAPDNFDIDMIKGAFKEKKKKNGMF
jgi:hypothetical protein